MNTTIQKLSSGVYSIDQEMVRCFLVLGRDRAMLLDTGAEECALMQLIRSVTDLPVLALHTHGDGDHTANDHLFDHIYAHPKEFDVIRKFRPGLTAHLHPVTGASSFDLGGRILSVLETPGHTPGSICLLDRTNRILFSGDTVSYGPVFLFGDHRDIRQYRKTLEYLMGVGGFDTVYPCHNSCPVSLTVIPALMAAVDGALDGSLSPTQTDMPMPDGAAPGCYTVGKCGILY
jgi:glyoxylase-like metal-dependent hydrolase (beta-lactamase superfamily II)